MSKSHPLKLKDNLGSLQRISSTEKNWLAYQAGLQINDGSIGDLTLTSTGNRLIGSFVDTYYNEAVGTHPLVNITSSQTTTNLYQKDDTAAETDSDWRLPIAYDSSDGNVYEMNSTNYTTLIDEINGIIHQNDYPSAFKLDSAGFSDSDNWTVHISNIFTDTINTGTVKNYSIFKRTGMTEPTRISDDSGNNSNLATIIRGDSDMDFTGLGVMTDRQAKYSLGQRAATRRGHSGSPGAYQLRSATQGPPTDPGTWISKGSAINSRREVSGSDYTRTRTSTYTDNYQRTSTRDDIENYSRDFIGDFTGDYTRDFVGEYTGDFIGNYQRVFTGDYVADYIGNYAGVYSRTSTRDFVGDYTRDFVGNYTATFQGNYVSDFLGNYVGATRESIFVGNYTGAYSRTRISTYTTDFIGNFLATYVGNYAGNYVGEFTTDFAGNYTADYLGTYNRTRDSVFTRNRQVARTSTYNREVNYLRYRTNTGYIGNYVGETTPGYIGNFVGAGGLTYLGRYTGAYTGNYFGYYVGPRDYVGTYFRIVLGQTQYYVGTYTGGSHQYGGLYTRNSAGTGTYGLLNNGVSKVPYSRFNYINYAADDWDANNNSSSMWLVYAPYEAGVPESSAVYDEIRIIIGGTDVAYIHPVDPENVTSVHLRNGEYQSHAAFPAYGDMLFLRGGPHTNPGWDGVPYLSTRPSDGAQVWVRRYHVRTKGEEGTTMQANPRYYAPLYYTGQDGNVFVGNYTGLINASIRESAGGAQAYYSRHFSRTVEGSVINYAGLEYLGPQRTMYSRDFTRTFTGDFTATYFGDFIGDYGRNFTRTRQSITSTRTSTRTRTPHVHVSYAGNFIGNFSRGFVGEYSGAYAGNYTADYVGNFERIRTSAFTRNRDSVFSRTRNSNYLGDYTADYLGNYAGEYTRTRTSNFTRDRVSAYTRNSTAVFSRTRTSNYTRNSTRTRTSSYAGNYIGNYVGDYVGNYQRSFLGNYTGDTIQSATETAETYTLYVRVA